MSKVVSRGKLIGMNVYNPDATYVGKVKDVGFTLEEGKPILIIVTKYQTEIEVDWGNVGAVGDIVILKKAVEVKAPERQVIRVQPSMTPQPTQPVTQPTVTTAPAQQVERRPKVPIKLPKLSLKKRVPKCPYCGGDLVYVKQYNRWWCPRCRVYPPPDQMRW